MQQGILPYARHGLDAVGSSWHRMNKSSASSRPVGCVASGRSATERRLGTHGDWAAAVPPAWASLHHTTHTACNWLLFCHNMIKQTKSGRTAVTGPAETNSHTTIKDVEQQTRAAHDDAKAVTSTTAAFTTVAAAAICLFLHPHLLAPQCAAELPPELLAGQSQHRPQQQQLPLFPV